MVIFRSRLASVMALPKVSTSCDSMPKQPTSGVTGRTKKGTAGLPFPARYADETTSDLKVTVKPSENNLEPIKLSSGPAAAKAASGKGLNQRD